MTNEDYIRTGVLPCKHCQTPRETGEAPCCAGAELDIAQEIITLVWVRGESIYNPRVLELVEKINGEVGGR